MEEAQSRLLEMEQELSLLQRERDEAQKAAVLLQSSVDQLTQVRTCEKLKNRAATLFQHTETDDLTFDFSSSKLK